MVEVTLLPDSILVCEDTMALPHTIDQFAFVDFACAGLVPGFRGVVRKMRRTKGVENERQLATLKLARCDHYQGFLFSPAIAVEDLEMLFAERAADAA